MRNIIIAGGGLVNKGAQAMTLICVCELKKRYPDKYIDTSILYKVLTGQVSSAFIVDGINSILNMKE